jgi:nicotinate-nucleotide adenylyltransferase
MTTQTFEARHIGLFGGTFDPPHVGHLLVASHVREFLALDRIIMIPSATSPHKRDRELTPADHRLAMMRLAVAGAPSMEVSDSEVQRGGVSYTIDTLRSFVQAEPDVEYTLIIGMDNVVDFGTWKDPEGILQLARVVVMTRPGYSAPSHDSRYARRMQMCSVPEIDIASRDIRRRIRESRSIRWMVTPEVEHYILQYGLYLHSRG